ncbi:hypothetical protein ACWGPO_26650 [Achromobacter animicus]
MSASSAVAARAAHIAGLSASPATPTASAAAGRPFNVVMGRVRSREIQRGKSIFAVTATSSIRRSTRAAHSCLANDHGASIGMMGHAERDQGHSDAEPERNTARSVDSIPGRICMSQRRARIRVHQWLILGGGFTRGFTTQLHPDSRDHSKQNR